MRYFLAVAVFFIAGLTVSAQPIPPRFGLIYNPDLYKQGTPKEALQSVIGSIERERYDYLAAHLLPASFVDGQLKTTFPYYEKVASEQIAATGIGNSLSAAEFQTRVHDKADSLNFKQLTDAIRHKLSDEPENIVEFKKFLRDGEFTEEGESAKVTLKDTKDRALYFKKVGNRWYMENRKQAAKE
jgi:hypothetical protein